MKRHGSATPKRRPTAYRGLVLLLTACLLAGCGDDADKPGDIALPDADMDAAPDVAADVPTDPGVDPDASTVEDADADVALAEDVGSDVGDDGDPGDSSAPDVEADSQPDVDEGIDLGTNPIPIYPTQELDGISQTELLALRRTAVEQHPELGFAETYEPNMPIWQSVVDGLPWWGVLGQFYYGSGDDAPQGTSEETRFILNPYVLVYADFYPMAGFFDRSLVDEADVVEGSDFPLDIRVEALDFDVNARLVTTSYHVTPYVPAIDGYALWPVDLQTLRFGVVGLNARDFGLVYLYVNLDESTNVIQNGHSATATHIDYFIHQGTSCGLASGCNNGSPTQSAFHQLSLTALPAELVVHLFTEPPADVMSPDYRVRILFR